MSKVLFVGGSKDGETIDVPADRHDVRVIVPESRPWAVGISHTTEAPYEEEMYTRQKLRGEAQTFEVFAPSHWTGDMLLSHLLNRATRHTVTPS